MARNLARKRKVYLKNPKPAEPMPMEDPDLMGEPTPLQPIKSQSVSNLIDDLYFGTAEKTVQESSYNAESQSKPYNPDDLFQKTNDYSLYEDMLKDDQVSVCMTIKKDLVIGSGWDIVVESKDEDHSHIKEDLEKALLEDPKVPFDDMLEEILTAYEFGFSLSEKIFQHRPDGSLSLNAIKTRHPSTWLIYTDKHGNVEKFEQRGTSDSFAVNPKSLIHYVNSRKFQNPYGKSDLRSAYNAWFIKRQIVRFYGIFLEKAASPVPVARYDANINSNAVTDIYNAIKKFQTKTALTIPKNIELEFLEAKNNGEVFIKGINIFNMFIGRSLVIPDLLGFQGAETSGGSFSLGQKQIEVLFKHIQRRRVSLERVVNKEIIQPLVIYNHGFVDHYPKFKLRPMSDDQLVDLAKLWIEVIKGKIYEPNEEEINHFRKLAKFPEGSVNIISQSGMYPLGLPGQQTNEGNSNGSKQSEEEQKGRQEEGSQQSKDSEDQGEEKEQQGDDLIAQGKSSTNKPRAGVKPFTQPEGEAKTYKVYDLPSGSYHRKVDFSALEAQMNRFKSRITTEALPIVKRIFEDLYQQMEDKKIVKDIKPERIDDIKLKYLKELKLVLKRNLREAHQDGKLSAQKELLKGNYRAPLADDKFLEVLEAELFQYIGDWSYNVTKDARIAMMEAIRDGKPLSSVIDSLDVSGLADSEVSLERFARTKTTEVMNRGRQAFFNETGVVAAYQYSAVLDDRTCFEAGTKVTMADYSVRSIETIQPGEFVLSGNRKRRRVLARKVAISNKWREITLENKEQIRATDTHPFWTEVQPGCFGWVESKNLSQNDKVGRIEVSSLREIIYSQRKCKGSDALQSRMLFQSKKSNVGRSSVPTVRFSVSSPQELAGRAPYGSKVLQQEMLDDGQNQRHASRSVNQNLRQMRKGIPNKANRIVEGQSPLQHGVPSYSRKEVSSLRQSDGENESIVLFETVLPQMGRRDRAGDCSETRTNEARTPLPTRSPIGKTVFDRFSDHGEDRLRDGRPLLAPEQERIRQEKRRVDSEVGLSIDPHSNCGDGSVVGNLAIAKPCHDNVPTPTNFIEITGTKEDHQVAFCYDLEIEEDHSYLVGDSRIIAHNTEICRGLHGKIFKAGTEPTPPMHFNCRSLLIPITKYEDFEASEKVGKTPIEQFIDENKGDGFSKN